MKITVEGLRSITFNKAFRGYEKVEVDQLLHELAIEWQKLLDEKENDRNELAKSEKELNRLKDVEMLMLKKIKEAEDNAANIIENATNTASTIVEKAQTEGDEYLMAQKKAGNEYLLNAENNADKIILDTENERDRLLLEANDKIESLKTNTLADIENSEKEYNSLDIAKQQLLYDLKGLLESTKDKLENIQTKYSPEIFDAKKQSLTTIEKAIVNTKITQKAPKQAIKKVEKTAVKTKAKSKKIPAPKQPKVKMQAPIEPEDDGLPTVRKILAMTEEPHLPTIKVDNDENQSFFDSI